MDTIINLITLITGLFTISTPKHVDRTVSSQKPTATERTAYALEMFGIPSRFTIKNQKWVVVHRPEGNFLLKMCDAAPLYVIEEWDGTLQLVHASIDGDSVTITYHDLEQHLVNLAYFHKLTKTVSDIPFSNNC